MGTCSVVSFKRDGVADSARDSNHAIKKGREKRTSMLAVKCVGIL